MALLHWRKFVFFDEEHVVNTELNQLVTLEQPKDFIDGGQPFITAQIICSSSGRGSILLGDKSGYVYIVNRYLKINSFKANHKFTSHVKQVPKLPTFITCGSDRDGINPLIKLWDPEKVDSLNQPTCIKVIRANAGFTKPAMVTCLDCNDTLTLMAVGYEDGTIVLFHGDIIKQRRSKIGRLIKISDRPISGIVLRSFVREGQATSSNTLYNQNSSQVEVFAFIATDEEIFYANLSGKSFTKVQLDQLGCQPRCCCLLPGIEGKANSENLFAVGRNNAVYFYQIDGRGPCLAFEGEKLILCRFKTYLVIVSRDLQGKLDSNSVRLRRSQVASEKNSPDSSSSRRLNLNIYDIKNKYIAHSSVIPEIQDIFSEWGQLFIVCTNGQVIKFREKDTQTKLDILFKKNQFSMVIEIAKSNQYSEDALTDIFKHYGDHLFRKGDYEGAVSQYIKTIGKSESSYVIGKFMDAKRIGDLTVFLEALHERSHASQDHTKLLLDCYSKMKNHQQLKKFIESYEKDKIKFDVEIAIRVLRDAGCPEDAIYLAQRHQKHELYFKIQMENGNNSEAVLDYMSDMTDPNEMALYMKEYGMTLLKECPEKTMSMIKTICRRSREKVKQSAPSAAALDPPDSQIHPEEFFHILNVRSDIFVQLLEQLIELSADFETRPVNNMLLKLYLNAWHKERDDLMRNTYVDKIKKLLSQQELDLNRALTLCRIHRFDDGLIDIYTRKGSYNLVLQYHIDQDDSLKIIKTCEEFGGKDTNLYVPTLIHYSKTGDERLTQILKAIEHHELIPPMEVIKILLDSKRTSLGLVKGYLVRFLSKLRDRHFDNEEAIDRYKDDTEVVRQKIDEFENQQTAFHGSKCFACQNILDLPSVHYLCGHSYHQDCLHNYSAESDECPICIATNRKLLNEIGSHETSKSTLNKIRKQLSAPNEDIFTNLAELFGYGLFNWL